MADGYGALSIIFLFFAVVIGGFFSYVLSHVFDTAIVPYTIIMFACGIIFSIVAAFLTSKDGHSHTDYLIQSINQWEKIDPYEFLYIFLPVLIFGETMTLNVHHVAKTFRPSLLLALPGASFVAYIIGKCCQYMLPYGWPWQLSYLVGIILCATDPVGVIALLKEEANTSVAITSLTYIIIGESILNDATSLVLFEIASKTVESEDLAMEYFVQFVKVIFISPCIGLAVGLGGVFCMRQCNRRVIDEDTTLQIALSLSLAYVSFFISQYVVGVSGIISCYFAGLIFSWICAPVILQPKSMATMWESLVWLAETLVFIISGLLVGRLVLSYFHLEDIASIFVVYLVIQASRIALMIVCHPLLQYLSPLYKLRDGIFICFSGVRGAVSLALVLLLSRQIEGETSDSKDLYTFPANDIHRATIIVCGAVTLTIAINGITCGIFLKALGIVPKDLPEDEQIVIQYIQKRISSKAKRTHMDLLNSLSQYDPSVSFKACSVLQPTLARRSTKVHHMEYSEEADGHSIPRTSTHDYSNHDNDPSIPQVHDHDAMTYTSPYHPRTHRSNTLSGFMSVRNMYPVVRESVRRLTGYNLQVADDKLLNKLRALFLSVLRKSYFKQIAAGHLGRGSNAALILFASIDMGLETTDTPGLQDWDAVESLLRNLSNLYQGLSYLTGNYFRDYFHEMNENDRVACLISFIEAHKYAQHKICQYMGNTEFADTPEENIVIDDSIDNVNKASNALNSADKDYVSFLVSKIAARMIIHTQEDTIVHFIEEGILGVKDADKLFQSAMHDLAKINALKCGNRIPSMRLDLMSNDQVDV